MATRQESVRISAIDDFSTPVAKMAAEAALFKRQLDALDGTNVRTSTSLRDTARSVDDLNASTRRGAADINQYSGRLRLFADAAITLGPSLLPIGAVAVPAVTGLASAFGFASAGATSAIVAFQGVGEALSAMRKAQLEPTAANLQAARDAMEQIGPHAGEFVRELTAMGPALREVRDSAAAGMFPGMVEALGHIEGALPRVASLFGTLGEAMGELSADAAESLTGPEWADFFAFIEAEAPAALSDLGSAVGSVAHGFAELWMAFAPLNRDFTGWLEDAARGFDKWAQGLSQTDGFAEFVDFIRESGPQVAAAAKAIGNALVQVVDAVSPLGGPTLAIITKFADALATLADSPLGTPLFALAASLRAVSFAAGGLSAAGVGMTAFGTGISGMVAKTGAVAGLALAFEGLANTTSNLVQFAEGADLAGNGVADIESALKDSAAGEYAADLGINLQRLAQDLAANGQEGEYVKQVMADLGDQSGLLATSFDSLNGANEALSLVGFDWGKNATEAQLAARAVAMVAEQYDAAGGAVSDMGSGAANLRAFFLEGADAAHQMSGAVDDLSASLASLSGWLDKREALQGWKDSLRALSESIKDGFQPADVANINAVGRSFLQVAESLKNQPNRQANFIQGAIKSLSQLADGAGPKAAGQIQQLIGRLKALDNTKANPKVGIEDGKFRAGAGATKQRMAALNFLKANPKVDLNDAAFASVFGLTKADLNWLENKTATSEVRANGSQALSVLGSVRSMIFGIPSSKTVTITTVHRDVNTGTIGHLATGGEVRGPGTATSDSIPAWLSNGEFVVRAAAVDHYGAGFLHQLNAMRLAEGGLATHTHARRLAGGGGVDDFGLAGSGHAASLMPKGFHAAEQFLSMSGAWVDLMRRELRAQIRDAEKRREAIEKEVSAAREFRDSLKQASDSLAESIGGKFKPGSDLLGEGATFSSVLSGLSGLQDAAGLNERLAGKLKTMGLDGDALQWLLENASNDQLRMFANSGEKQLELFEAQFNATNLQAQRTGQTAATLVMGERLAEANVELRRLNEKYDRAEERAKRFEKKLEELSKAETTATRNVGKDVAKALDRTGGAAARRNS